MDIGEVLKNAWQLTWRNKFLLILGFLAGLGSTTTSTVNYSFDSGDVPLVTETRIERFLEQYWFVLIGLTLAVILITVVLWLVRLTAQGGLISAVARLDGGEGISLGQALSSGVRFLWRMVGLILLLYAPFILLVGLLVVSVLVVASGALGMVLFSDQEEFFSVLLTSSALLTGCLGILLCILIPLLLAVSAFYPFAQRALVLSDLGVIDSVKQAWRTVTSGIGEVILLVILLMVLSIGYGFFVALVTLPFTFLAFFPTLANIIITGNFGPGDFILMACGGFAIAVIASLLSALLMTYRSAVVTLAYQQLLSNRDVELAPQ